MATKTEIERLSVVETKVDRAVDDIGKLATTVKDGFTSIETKFDNLSKENDKKYAAKWVQSALTFVIGLIVAAVITAWLAFVVITPNRSNNPTTSTTTTTTTPTGSTGTTTTKDGTPSANANANATSTPANPTDSDSSSSGGLLDQVPKVIP